MTPASGVGAPRTSSAQLVPGTPASSALDRGDTSQDHESIRDIRSLLASDPTLASIAPQVTIVARNGRVWLRGQVTTKEQRSAIEKAARRAVWVVDVNNELATME
jgi:osmotically-inducible protein OsmY